MVSQGYQIGPKSPMNPSFSHTGHSGSRPQNQFQASGQGKKSQEICVKFNKFRKAHCELDNNVCYYDRLHKCQVCYNRGCKALNHHNSSNSSTIINNSCFNSARSTSVSGTRPVKNYCHPHVASGDVDQCFGNDNQQISGSNNGVNITTDTHCQNSDLTSVLSSMNNSFQSLSVRVEKNGKVITPQPLVSPPAATGTDLLQAPAYSCPAITAIPNHITFSDLDLANKYILWTPITFVGVSLPLPLDSCCSLSLVSKAHADIVAQKHPHLTFTK